MAIASVRERVCFDFFPLLVSCLNYLASLSGLLARGGAGHRCTNAPGNHGPSNQSATCRTGMVAPFLPIFETPFDKVDPNFARSRP